MILLIALVILMVDAGAFAAVVHWMIGRPR